MNAQATQQAEDTATRIIEDAVVLGASNTLLQRFISALREDNKLEDIHAVLKDCAGIQLFGGMPRESFSAQDDSNPGALGLLLANLGPETFSLHLPHLAGMLSAITDMIVTERAYEFKEHPAAVAELLTDVLGYYPIIELSPTVTTAKLKSLLTIILRNEEAHVRLNEDGKAKRRAVMNAVIPYMHIPTSEYAMGMTSSPIAFAFRKEYVNTVFQRPSFGKATRFYYPDRIIDQMAELSTITASDYENSIADDFNGFLINDPTVAEVDEVLAYINYFKGVNGRSWIGFFRSLRHTAGAPYSEDYSKLTGKERAQTEAILMVLSEVFAREDVRIPGMENLLEDAPKRPVVWRLADERLIEFLINHPERAAEVARVARERNTLDWGMVAVALESNPALGEGVL